VTCYRLLYLKLVYFLARYAATMSTLRSIFGAHLLDYVEHSRLQWFPLTKFVKASKIF